MKTKYVFVIQDDAFPPNDLERCYIFDNFDDARSFYTGKGYNLELYSCDKMFYISKTVKWGGRSLPRALLNDKIFEQRKDLYKGLYH